MLLNLFLILGCMFFALSGWEAIKTRDAGSILIVIVAAVACAFVLLPEFQ